MRPVKKKTKRPSKKTVVQRSKLKVGLKSAFVKVFLSTTLFIGMSSLLYLKVWPYACEKVHDLFLTSTQKLGFITTDVMIEGREFTSQELLNETLTGVYGSSIFTKSLKEIKLSLESIPWVDKVEVQRFLPSRLKISIHERVPIAVWQNDKKLYLVDQEGFVIQCTQVMPNVQLPLVVGEDAPQAIAKLIQLLRPFPDLLNEIEHLRFVSKRRWNIVLKNKVVIMLPQEDLSKSLVTLSAVLKNSQANRDDLEQIDLRLKDKVGLKFTSIQKLKNSKKEKEA
jgi:cell division protein FtsQ